MVLKIKEYLMAVCNKCNGNKTILGMGSMKEKCPACKGVGSITETPKKAKPESKKSEKPKDKE
jgi:DnaJ-class molecular chaperone